MPATENLNINLNQNLWVLVVSLIALGVSEYFNLCTLYYFGLILSICAGLSIIVSLFAYTKNYWRKRIKNN
jgi:hypothetical protein